MALSAQEARWYLIQTKPRQEARAEEHLRRQHFQCYRPLQVDVKKPLPGFKPTSLCFPVTCSFRWIRYRTTGTRFAPHAVSRAL